MNVLPPGTLLQLMYLGERLQKLRPGRFIEIGPGSGEVTNALLQAGWVGTVFELSEATAAKLRDRFALQIGEGRLAVRRADFLKSRPIAHDTERADLIISCMVMEHMDERAERAFMIQGAKQLRDDGCMIGFVPASPAHWGIEDEIAGHYRRYDKQTLEKLFRKTRWKASHMAGLTFPVSNMLLPISNHLVRKHEESKKELSLLERTKLSGNRAVQFKTHFPALLILLLNRSTMRPLHWLQKLFSKSESALVLYFEATKQKP